MKKSSLIIALSVILAFIGMTAEDIGGWHWFVIIPLFLLCVSVSVSNKKGVGNGHS